jgi:hypothetical protein
MDFFAHSAADKSKGPPEGWQPLKEHLRGVAELARRFADVGSFDEPIITLPSGAQKKYAIRVTQWTDADGSATNAGKNTPRRLESKTVESDFEPVVNKRSREGH